MKIEINELPPNEVVEISKEVRLLLNLAEVNSAAIVTSIAYQNYPDYPDYEVVIPWQIAKRLLPTAAKTGKLYIATYSDMFEKVSAVSLILRMITTKTEIRRVKRWMKREKEREEEEVRPASGNKSNLIIQATLYWYIYALNGPYGNNFAVNFDIPREFAEEIVRTTSKKVF
ncbi:MAG: hypothetical protein QXM92_00495 [Candidatus Anstonellales archaeon]